MTENALWCALTKRRKEAVLLILDGSLSRDAMAKAMGCSVKTFDSHRLSALWHLDCANDVQLYQLARRVGVVR